MNDVPLQNFAPALILLRVALGHSSPEGKKESTELSDIDFSPEQFRFDRPTSTSMSIGSLDHTGAISLDSQSVDEEEVG